MAFLTYAYILVAFFVANSYQTNFMPCKNQPAPKSVNLVGCSSLPCSFKRGTFVEADITFSVTENTKTLKPDVLVQLGDANMKYPFPQQNACQGLTNAECPLDKGELVTYKLKMPIEKFYPKVSMTIEFALVDDLKKSQMCVKIPANVVD